MHLFAVAPLFLAKETATKWQGHLGHRNDEAEQCLLTEHHLLLTEHHLLLTEHHFVSQQQAAAARARLETLHGLPKLQVGADWDPHLQVLVAVVPVSHAECLLAGLVPQRRKGRSRGDEEQWGRSCSQPHDFLLTSM